MKRSNVSRIRADVPPPKGFTTVAAVKTQTNQFIDRISTFCDESVARCAIAGGPEVAAEFRRRYDEMLADIRKRADGHFQ
jgi:hypothetical protein